MAVFLPLIETVNDFYGEIDKKYFNNSSKYKTRDVIVHNMITVIENKGIRDGNILFDGEIKTKIKTSISGIEKASKKIPAQLFNSLANNLITKHFNHKNRILLCDGSVLNISKDFQLDDGSNPFEPTNTGSYVMGYLLVVYDVEMRVPICCDLRTSCHERESLMALSRYFQPGDTLIVDAGFYSKELFKFFAKMGVFLLCRLSRANKKIMGMKGGSDIDIKSKGFSARRITCFIETEDGTSPFTFVTNIPRNKMSLKQLIELYHQRWAIEEFFKTFKVYLGGDFYFQKSMETLLRKIYSQMLVSIISGAIMRIVDDALKSQPNKKASAHYILTPLKKIVFRMLHDTEVQLSEIDDLLTTCMTKCYTTIHNGRHFHRKCNKPPSKFYGIIKKKNYPKILIDNPELISTKFGNKIYISLQFKKIEIFLKLKNHLKIDIDNNICPKIKIGLSFKWNS